MPNAGPNKKNGQLMLKRPELPDGFQGSVFKGKVRERVVGCGISSCMSFRLVGGEVAGQYLGNLNHQPSGSNRSGVYVLVVSMQLMSSIW